MRRRLLVILATALAAAVAGVAHPAAHAATGPLCKAGYYKNVDGVCVRRPTKASSAPAGATAKCRDGSYSFSRHASGTCSGHGGVAVWIHHP
jgi:hypothetical protein